MDTAVEFRIAWELLGDVPVNEEDEIEEDFLHFEKGTDKFAIWSWLEDKFDICLGDYINGGLDSKFYS